MCGACAYKGTNGLMFFALYIRPASSCVIKFNNTGKKKHKLKNKPFGGIAKGSLQSALYYMSLTGKQKVNHPLFHTSQFT